MCRIFGLASRNRISPLWFNDFHKLAANGRELADRKGEHHEDGWGIAGYLGNWAVHFDRSENGATGEAIRYAAAVEKSIRSGSRILVAHLRQASEGSRVLANAHPFVQDDWIFCHNGTVYDSERLMLGGMVCEGTTDSERLFKFLVSRLERRRSCDYPAALRGALAEVRARCRSTSLTFLLSNGQYLIGYRDYTEDEDYYTLHYSLADNTAFLFCSEQLPGFTWESMRNGDLVMVDKVGGFIHEF